MYCFRAYQVLNVISIMKQAAAKYLHVNFVHSQLFSGILRRLKTGPLGHYN